METHSNPMSKKKKTGFRVEVRLSVIVKKMLFHGLHGLHNLLTSLNGFQVFGYDDLPAQPRVMLFRLAAHGEFIFDRRPFEIARRERRRLVSALGIFESFDANGVAVDPAFDRFEHFYDLFINKIHFAPSLIYFSRVI